jgi:hypothetical protein
MRKRLFVILAVVAVGGLLSSAAVVHAQNPPPCTQRQCPTTGISCSFFGLHINQTDAVQQISDDPWPTTENVCFGIFRTHDANGDLLRYSQYGLKWSDIETSQGNYVFGSLDEWVEQFVPHGGDQGIIFTGFWTPSFWSSDPTDQCGNTDGNPYRPYGGCDLPQNSDGSYNPQPWKSFISAVVQHMTTKWPGTLKYIEVWNEPSDSNKCNPNHNYCTPAELARMTSDANYIVSHPPTGIQIISPPLANGGFEGSNSYFQQLLTAGIANPGYANVIGFHGYPGEPPDTTMIEEIGDVTNLLSANGTPLPIFDTESSWESKDEISGKDGNYDDEDMKSQAAWLAASYLVQAYYTTLPTSQSYLIGSAFDGWDYGPNSYSDYPYAVHALWNTGSWGNDQEGLTRAGVAYQNVYWWLLGATPTSACSQSILAGNTVFGCNFTNQAQQGQTQAVWYSCSDGQYDCGTSYSYSPPFTYYLTLTGQVCQLSNGSVQIDSSPILLVTGTWTPSC